MKVDVLGVKIDALKKDQVISKIKEMLNMDKSVFIVTPYSESLVSVQKNPEYKEILNSVDIALADGVGVLWAANFLSLGSKKLLVICYQLLVTLLSIIFNPKSLHKPIPQKIPGSKFIWDLAELAAGRGESVFLLGGFGDTPEKVSQKLKAKFPNLKIAGTYSNKIDANAVEKINSSGADYLFVAIGPEKQERWIYENRRNLTPKLLIGLGGTFDYIAQKRLNTPHFLALTGLEWLWRLITQPWRFRRIFRGIFGLIYYSFKARVKVYSNHV